MIIIYEIHILNIQITVAGFKNIKLAETIKIISISSRYLVGIGKTLIYESKVIMTSLCHT